MCGTGVLSAATKATVPAKYATWLNEEVPYIISNAERSAFLALKTDADRDAFIQNFWEIRNPDPNSPTNQFRDEYYRRLAYANDQFGSPGRHDGWRTARGMVYITLGPPQQLTPYRSSQYLTPLEIWFYQSPSTNHALPPYFYLVFYQRTLNEDYKLYSPMLDKPERLVQSTNAVNDEAMAIKIIKQDLGDLDRVVSVEQLRGFVRSSPTFIEQPEVIDGASNLLVELWGEAGSHARTATGAAQLPFGAAVQLDLVLRVRTDDEDGSGRSRTFAPSPRSTASGFSRARES